MKNHNELKYWLALLRIPAINDPLFAAIVQKFADLAHFFSLKEIDYHHLKLPDEAIQQIKQVDWSLIEQDLAWETLANHHHILTLSDNHYPNLLRHIIYPPPVLFVVGDIDLLSEHQIAIVGSRKPTPTGTEIAYDFASKLAEKKIVITSGLARGIDAAAHSGALSLYKTIAVIGTGINLCYPKQNQALRDQIQENGAIITEFPLNTPPFSYNFPRRNRIISGLSLGTVVVEANLKSGSLITAKLSIDQGREVFAVPGSIYNPRAGGCHLLLKQGAKLTENITDILEEIPALMPKLAIFTQKSTTSEHKGLDADHLILLECVGYEPTKSDILVARSLFNIKKVTSLIFDLELAGCISSTPSGYVRVSR